MGAPEGEEVMATELEQAAEGEELSAPPGWKKKVASKRGGAFRRGDTSFVAPNGDEIKSKRQLERYLKANPGGPALADFDWSTGETPRRSERLSSRKRLSDFEPELVTTPRRTRKRKSSSAAAASAATGDKSGEEGEDGKDEETGKEEPPTTTTKQAEKDQGAQENAPDDKVTAAGEEDAQASADATKGVDVTSVKAPPPPAISCAKTETLTKSQEAQPAQIGVS